MRRRKMGGDGLKWARIYKKRLTSRLERRRRGKSQSQERLRQRWSVNRSRRNAGVWRSADLPSDFGERNWFHRCTRFLISRWRATFSRRRDGRRVSSSSWLAKPPPACRPLHSVWEPLLPSLVSQLVPEFRSRAWSFVFSIRASWSQVRAMVYSPSKAVPR